MATISSTMPVTASRRTMPAWIPTSHRRGAYHSCGVCAPPAPCFSASPAAGATTPPPYLPSSRPPPHLPSSRPPPPAQAKTFSTFQAASVVVGQADFTSNVANRGAAPGANTLTASYGDPAVGSLYVPDYFKLAVCSATRPFPPPTEQRLISSSDSPILQTTSQVSHRNGNVYPAARRDLSGEIAGCGLSQQSRADLEFTPYLHTNPGGCGRRPTEYDHQRIRVYKFNADSSGKHSRPSRERQLDSGGYPK